MKINKEVVEFQWDEGNIGKNIKHNVEEKESEEPFFDNRKTIYKDVFHSQKEERHILIGKTKRRRLLYIVFTKRRKKIRIISARDTNKKEEKFYEKTTQNS